MLKSALGARLALCAFALLIIAVFYGPTDNWNWDPSFYYAQVRAPLIAHSLDFRAETLPPNAMPARTATGLQPSQWPVGPSILWSPFFLLAHLVVLLTRPALPADGFSWPYVAAVSAGSALYGFLGLNVTYCLCRVYAPRGPALLSAALALLATPLFFYVLRQPLMAHSAAFLAAALLLFVLVMLHEGRIAFRYSGLLIGALLGLNVLLRWVGVTAALLPTVLFALYLVAAVKAGERRRVVSILQQTALTLLVTFVVVSPQLAFWHTLYGSWLVRPIQGFTSGATPVNVLNLFVHTNRGLLYWAPFVLAGFVGVWCIPSAALRAACVVYLAAYVGVLGFWGDWTGGGGFGPRFFIETLPIAALGFACLVRRAWTDWRGKWALGAVALFLVAHQLMLVTTVEQSWLPLAAYLKGEPLGLRFQVENALRLLGQPGDLFLPRPYVSATRQTAFVSYLADQRALNFYLFPLVAAVLVPLGILLYGVVAKLRALPIAALCIAIYMLFWCVLYLNV